MSVTIVLFICVYRMSEIVRPVVAVGRGTGWVWAESEKDLGSQHTKVWWFGCHRRQSPALSALDGRPSPQLVCAEVLWYTSSSPIWEGLRFGNR